MLELWLLLLLLVVKYRTATLATLTYCKANRFGTLQLVFMLTHCANRFNHS